MKIISGEKKGHKIFGPGPEEIRPMRHSVRKALFDILQNVIEGSRFLDLFAGTGGVGLEALSQGASHATFVDNLSESVKLVGKSIEKLGYQEVATLYEMEVSAALDKFESRDRRFDIIFLGPPYEKGLTTETLNQLKRTNVIRRWGIVGVEVFFKTDLNEAYGVLEKIDSREYGQSKLVIYRNKP
ncbi:16S rRNA (guanine(966)-N(2))-methyltransferase RsmD [Candidatus Bipolaricaulota bacterium]|nr:16S rRNA (guanine(966)-N(2))-methyltransferase RsmD [Candidatus Bipolaricaulota bacterium]